MDLNDAVTAFKAARVSDVPYDRWLVQATTSYNLRHNFWDSVSPLNVDKSQNGIKTWLLRREKMILRQH